MRCKKHACDPSSSLGVCATCLREKLYPILAVQSKNQSPPLIFPRSVSPPHLPKTPDPIRLFFSTPQLAPTKRENKIKREKITRFSLFPNFLKSRSNNKNNNNAAAATSSLNVVACRGRGMSPARVSDCGGGDDVAVARRGGGFGVPNVAGFVFCLSPLVRARPKRRRNSKIVPPEAAAVAAVKPQMAAAAAFCANRSRKVADFGRMHRRH